MIKVQHPEEIKTWSDTLDDHHVHYDILKKKYDDSEERYEVYCVGQLVGWIFDLGL